MQAYSGFYYLDKVFYERVVLLIKLIMQRYRVAGRLHLLLHFVHHITGNLRRQNTKVIGNNNKDDL